MEKFINLHLNTEYSLLESTIRIDDLFEFAIQRGIKVLPITDRNNMFGVPYFLEKANKHNIKPIIGLDLDVSNYRLILIAKNYKGYCELIRLSSKKMMGDSIMHTDIEAEDLFVIDHPTEGYYYKHDNNYLNIENYFLGLTKGTDPHGVAIFETKTLDGSSIGLELLESIKLSKPLSEISKKYTNGFMSEVNLEMAMIKQAQKIVNACNVVFPKTKNLIPIYPSESKSNSDDFLRKQLLHSLKNLFETNIELDKQIYLERYKHELEIIQEMNFSDYFLILADIVQWAKKNKIMVGPGRGSSSGSLISYLLGITEVDPIKYNLIFERFLNPQRVSMPDIDVDIQDTKREDVIKYIINKYSQEHVANIITFSTLGAKMSLRDVGRAIGMSVREVDAVSIHIKSFKNGETYSLDNAYEKVPAFRALVDNDPRYTILFKYSKLIEGLPRQTGTHAAGIILCSKKLEEVIPIMRNDDGIIQTQYSMNYLEMYGLLKIDLLGLRNLTIIEEVQKEIYKNYNRKVNLHKINFASQETNELLSKGDTNGIFQLESWGMKNALQLVKVNSIDDVIAIIALFRPGPMDQIEEYAERKNNHKDIEVIDSSISPILKETYGIIVYQEQIMQIVQIFAGMSMAQADTFRRGIGKKDSIILESLRSQFIMMSIAKNRSEKVANEVWDLIIKFAAYGFNKAHAVAYAMIAYWMAYLKSRFPVEFYTPLLNGAIASQTSTKIYINEIRSRKNKVVPPNVNLSKKRYYNKDGVIYMPLIYIKGLGTVMNTKIIDERIEYGNFKDFIDFVVRAKRAGVVDGTIEILIKAGALRDFGNVASLSASLLPALRFASMVVISKNDQLVIDDSIISRPLLITAPRNLKEEITYDEKFYGFSLNAHLTDMYLSTNKLIDLSTKQEVSVVAQVLYVNKVTIKNREMAYLTIEDSTNEVEIFIDPGLFKYHPNIKKKEIYLFKINKSEYKDKITYKVISMELQKEKNA